MQCESVDERFQELCSLISGHEEKIKEYAARHGLEVYGKCNIKIFDDRPLYELSSGSIQILADLNAKFEMEIFDLQEHICTSCDDFPINSPGEEEYVLEPIGSEIKAGLMIAGDHLDFEELSACIGLHPTKTHILKLEYYEKIKLYPRFKWILDTGYAECDCVDTRFEQLFSIIAGHEEKIIGYTMRNDLKVYAECKVRIHREQPLYELSSSALKKLAALNAMFEMDIFDFRTHQCTECFDRRNS